MGKKRENFADCYTVTWQLMADNELNAFTEKHWGVLLLFILWGCKNKKIPIRCEPYQQDDLGIDDLYKVLEKAMANKMVAKGAFLNHLDYLLSKKLVTKKSSSLKKSKKIILLSPKVDKHLHQIFDNASARMVV